MYGRPVAVQRIDTDAGVVTETAFNGAQSLNSETTPGSNNRRVLIGMLLASALLAAALTAAVARPKPLASDTANLDVLLEAWTRTPRTGCRNWEALTMVRGTYQASAEDCGAACQTTSGCTGFNHQPGDCASEPDNMGSNENTCVLLHGECHEVPNTCWDLYDMTSPMPADWCLHSSRTGCSNWENSEIETTVVSSIGKCGLKCQATPGCDAFNFQPGVCAGSERQEQGSCMLLSENCSTETNTCWDLYTMGPCFEPTYAMSTATEATTVATTTAAATTVATTTAATTTIVATTAATTIVVTTTEATTVAIISAATTTAVRRL